MSIAEAAASEDARVRLGRQLREARTRAKMSLREMARRVNVSASFVSQVELGRATPSIGTLYSIVSELGLSLDSLMEGQGQLTSLQGDTGAGGASTASSVVSLPAVAPQPPRSRLQGLQRPEERPAINVGGVKWERLTDRDDPYVEFLRVTYTSGSQSSDPDNLMTHGGYEYLHILEGKLNVEVGFNRDTLVPGDSLNFDSSTPHRLSNPYSEDCIAIWFVVGRQGGLHPAMSQFDEQAGRPTRSESGPSQAGKPAD